MIYLDMYKVDKYRAEINRILYQNGETDWHDVIQFMAAMTCLSKEVKDLDFGSAPHTFPKDKEEWMILYNICKKLENIVSYYEKLVLWRPYWFSSLISNAVSYPRGSSKSHPTVLFNNAVLVNNGNLSTRTANALRINWIEIINKNFDDKDKLFASIEILSQGKGKIRTLNYYIHRYWIYLQFIFAILDYLVCRIPNEKYNDNVTIRLSSLQSVYAVNEHYKILNNPENYQDVIQTVNIIHNIHVNIDAVNTILMVKYDTDRLLDVGNNGYNRWI